MNPVPGPHLSPDDVDAWISGALAPEVREHLDRCAPCLERIESEREVVALLAGLPLMSPAPDFADRVMQAVSLPDPFSLRSIASVRRRISATPRNAALAAVLAICVVGSMAGSIVWSLGHQDVLTSIGSWVLAQAWQTGWLAIRGVAANLMEQPWYASLRQSTAHPALWAGISATASLAYVGGVFTMRRLLTLPTRQVPHASL